MTAYTFETITDAPAAVFSSGDTLFFVPPGATASQVRVTFTPASGGAGLPPSPVIPAKITLAFNGVSREFNAAALAGYGGFTGQINFPDGSMLYPGTGGADCLQGSGFGDGLFGDEGSDTFAGGDGDDFVAYAVRLYWERFKPNIGIMLALDQLAATEPRFALLQNGFRRFGTDIVSASVRRAQRQGYAADLDADHIALAIALLFERFTSVSLSLGLSDAAAVTTLSTIWRKTLYGESKES